MEAEVQVGLWKEQADEARKENVQFKSTIKVLQAELDSTRNELAQVQGEHERQRKLVQELGREIGRPVILQHRFRSIVN